MLKLFKKGNLKMKKILSVAVLLASMSLSTFAQQVPHKVNKDSKRPPAREMVNKSPEEVAKLRTERLDRELKFSDKQRKEVYAFHLKEAKEHKAKKDRAQKERQVTLKERKTSREKFEKILTPQQKEVLKNKLASREKRSFKRPGVEGRRFDRDRKFDKKSMEKGVDRKPVVRG